MTAFEPEPAADMTRLPFTLVFVTDRVEVPETDHPADENACFIADESAVAV